MNPFSPSATALAGFAGVVCFGIVALYLFGRRGRRLTVPSLVIWQRLGDTSPAARWRVRWWASLALALVAGTLTLAAMIPSTLFAPVPTEDWLLIIDTTASMHARTADGRSRVEHAKALAAQRLGGAPPGTRAMLVDTTSQYRRRAWEPARTVLADIDGFVSRPLARRGSMPVPPPSALPRRTILFTDGVAPLAPGIDVERVGVFQPSDNVGVLSLAVRSPPGEPARAEAVLRIVNGSAVMKTIDVSIGAGGTRLTRRIVAAAEAERAESFDVSSLPSGPIEAVVSAEGDAFSFDDRAYAVLPEREPLPVMLVTASGTRLETALRLLPGITLRVVDPARFEREGPGDAALLVLDAVGTAPDARVPSIVFGGSADGGAPVTDLPGPVAVLRPREAIASGVAWGDVHVTRGRATRAGPGTIVAAAHDRSIELVGFAAATSNTPARLDIRFRLEDSNLATQGRFPAFLGAAIERFDLRPGPALHAPGLVTLGADPSSVVRHADGIAVPVIATDEGFAFHAETAGIYTLDDSGGRRHVVVSHAEAAISLINRSPFAPMAVRDDVIAPRANPADTGAWQTVCLLLAIGLLVVEAIAFTRRHTE